MNLRTRKLLVAWLGLIAMGLFVLAPVVSQFVMSARADSIAVAMCSAAQPPVVFHHTDTAPSADTMAACDYCTLQATHLVLPTLPQWPLIMIALVAVLVLPVLRTRAIAAATFPSARSHAPPAVFC